jgi:E3 SUMO-protein ligase PIAS1
MLVEVTGVDELVDRLKKGKFVSKEDILVKSESDSCYICCRVLKICEVRRGLSEDDDIVAGQQKMSLKCPVRFMTVFMICHDPS